jgi:2'-5' RNA ligase
MRLFLAFLLSESLRDNLVAGQARLQASNPDVRWSSRENLHLTVKFLGDRDDTLLPDVMYNAEWIAGECASFRFRVQGVSFFPRHKPDIKTIWAGVHSGVAEWRAVAEKAQEAFAPFGVAQDGGLVPHITLGRVRSSTGKEALREAISQEAETEFGTQEATHLTLVQSTLDPDGAIYTELGSYPLLSHSPNSPLHNVEEGE